MTEAEAKEAAEKAKIRVAKQVQDDKKNGKKNEPVQVRVKSKAAQMDEIQKEELKIKEAKKALKEKNLSKEEKDLKKAEIKRDEAKLKLMKAEKKLKEAQDKKNEKAIEKAKKAVEKAKKEVAEKQAKLDETKKKQKMDPKQVAKKANKNEKAMDEAGIKKEDPKNSKKGQEKEQNNEKNKSPEQKKQEEMQQKYQHRELPGGMIIKQEGPSWKLYSPDMKRSKDVTHEVESLIKTNKEIDAANEKIDKNNKLKEGNVGNNLGKDGDIQARDPKKVAAMEDNAAMGISTGQMRVADPDKGMTDAPVSVPDVKITDIDGKELKPEVAKDLAKFTVEVALHDNDLEKLKEEDRRQKKEQGKSEPENMATLQRIKQLSEKTK